MALTRSIREGRIESLRGPCKDPVPVAPRQTGQRFLRRRQELRQRALAGRIIRSPRQAGSAEPGDETWKKSFGRGFPAARLDKDPRRELWIASCVRWQAEQAGGPVVGRAVGELAARAVVENDVHVRKTPGHARRLWNGFRRHLQAD